MAETRSTYFELPRYDLDTDAALSRTDWEEAAVSVEARVAYDDGVSNAALPADHLKPGRYARQDVTGGFALWRRGAAAWEWVGGPVMPVRRYFRGALAADIVWSTDVAAAAAAATMTAGGELATNGAVRTLQGAVGADLNAALNPLTTGRLYTRTRATGERAAVASAHASDAGNLFTALDSGGQAIWTVDAAGRMQARLASGFGAASPVAGVPLSSAAIVGTAGSGSRLHGSTAAPISPGLEVFRDLADAAAILTALPDHITIGRTPWTGGEVSLIAPTLNSAGTYTHTGAFTASTVASVGAVTGWGGRACVSVPSLASVVTPAVNDLVLLGTDKMIYRWTGSAWLGVAHTAADGHARYSNEAPQPLPTVTARKVYLPTALNATADVSLTAGTVSTGSYFTLNRGGVWSIVGGVGFGSGAGANFRSAFIADDVNSFAWQANSGRNDNTLLTLGVALERRFPAGQRVALWAYHETAVDVNIVDTGEETSLSLTWLRP
jgi:hypothetical protein